MKAYIQLFNNYVVMVSDIEDENLIEIELPEDFDYDHIDWYEYVDGELVYHDFSEDIPVTPSQEERIAALEAQVAAQNEQLAAYEAAYAEGVQDA